MRHFTDYLPDVPERSLLRSRVTSLALSATLAIALLLSPTTALARILTTDEIAGVPLSESGLEKLAPDIGATSGLVMDCDGRVLWARSIDAQRAMASVTKIMTALLVLENANLDDVVTVSNNASSVDYAIGLKPGERLTVRELLEFALVTSSNDAAIALAEHVGGSVTGFTQMMNARAEELGLDRTHYVNPHGLDAVGHYSCAADIAQLAQLAMRNPEFRKIVGIEKLTLGAYQDRVAEDIESTDELLGVYEGLVGVKTGFTDDAGYCFVGEATRNGVVLTTVVLDAPDNDARFDQTGSLLDWGFRHLTMQTIATSGETVGAIPIIQNISREVTLGYGETTSVPVFDLDGEVTRTVSVDSSVSLPVYAGQPLGEARVYQGDRALATLPIVATQDIASAEETVGAVPVSDYLDVTVTARATGEPLDVPQFDPNVVVTRTIALSPEVKAPVTQGDLLGDIVYTQDGEVILTVPVVAAADIEAPGALERVSIWFERAWNWITGKPRIATLQTIDS